MLTELDKKKILKIIRNYRFAKLRLADNCGARRVRRMYNDAMRNADEYLYMYQSNMQNISSDDVKYFALLVDNFEQMRRERLLNDLQKYADFDVFYFVEQYNTRRFLQRVLSPIETNVQKLSRHDMDKMREYYKNVSDKVSDGKRAPWYNKKIEQYRACAYAYARGITNGNVVVADEDLESCLKFISGVCYPCVDGDVASRAKYILEQRINDLKKQTVVVTMPGADKMTASQLREQKRAEKTQQRNNRRQERVTRRQERASRREQKIQNVVGAVSNFYSDVTVKLQNLKQDFETKKSERRKMRENKKSENADKKHWFKTIARVALPVIGMALLGVGISALGVKTTKNSPEPQKKEIKEVKTVKQARVVVKNDANKTIQSYDAPVAFDTAYIDAMNNYCNSAMDIIAGEKNKNDVMTKLNNQVKNGNLVLNDSISVERVAYTYFIYREYGFNIDVLNLAVNGNQKLSAAQQSELLNVINAAGERGIGVQKMARERVNARGGDLGHHSKFEHATRAQQRAHLVNRGVLKKVQHNR